MAQATTHQLSPKPKGRRASPNQWAEDNMNGRRAAEAAISAGARQESPMEIVATIRKMTSSQKLSGFDVGYITAIAEAAISSDVD